MKEREETIENTGPSSYNRHHLGHAYIPGSIDTIDEAEMQKVKDAILGKATDGGLLINKSDVQFIMMQVYAAETSDFTNPEIAKRIPFEGSVPMVLLTVTAVVDTSKRPRLTHTRKVRDIHTSAYKYESVEEATKSLMPIVAQSAERIEVIDAEGNVHGTLKDQFA